MNLNEQIYQINREKAINGEVKTSLADVLNSMTKERLSLLASSLDLAGRSKMKSVELAAALYQRILDKDKLRQTLLVAQSEEWELFQTLLNQPFFQDNYIPYGHYAYLSGKALVLSFLEDGKIYLAVPEEVKVLFGEIDNREFRSLLERYHKVYQYITAMASLYGALPPDKLIEVFNAQNDEPISEEEFWCLYNAFTTRKQPFGMRLHHIVSDYFRDDAELRTLLERAQGKPYYIPEKDELLKYSESCYFEMTPQLIALKGYILKNISRDRELVDQLVDDIQLVCSMEDPIQSIFDEFNRRDMVFQSQQQVKDIMQYVMDVYNHTRIWSNRGHTPAELKHEDERALMPMSKQPLQVLIGGQASSGKVGRNDPCPCGSGKKYKKCCGNA